MIQFFMKQGLAIDARDNKSNTPLHTYLEQNRKDDDAKEVLELFFEAGAPLEAQNTDNQNCIELAQKKGIHIITLHREWHARINPSLKDKAKKKIAKLSSSIFGKKKE